MQTVNVGSSVPAAQLVEAGQGTTLIANNDPQFTLWIGDSYAILATGGGSTQAVPLSAGSSVVVDGKSDVFAIADPAATNSIQAVVIEGGLSFFQPFTELVVQGSTARVLIYSGLAGLGTLIGSWAAVAGTDIYGNNYPAGLNVVTQALINNATIVNAVLANAVINASQLNQSTIFESTVTFDTTAGVLLMYSTTTTTVTLSAGTNTWTSPAGSYTSGYVKVWGSGASGNGGSHGNYSGSGNGGGGYAENNAYPLTPSTTYGLIIPTGGAAVNTDSNGHTGATATFDTGLLTGPSVSAFGGSVTVGNPGGGRGGRPSIGALGYNGGSGGAASNKNTSLSGGGGAAGGPGGTGGDGGQDGPAGIGHGGGNGGAGVTQNNNGGAGSLPGGGGGGAGWTSTAGGTSSGKGGDARITVQFNTGTVTLAGAASPIAGTDAIGNAFAAGFTGLISAFTPGSSPSTVESWHTGNTISGMTGTNRYKAVAINCVLVDVDLTGNQGAGTSVLLFTLPSGWAPTIEHRIPMGSSVTGFTASYLLCSTNGQVIAEGLPASTSNRICVTGLIPLD